MLGTQRKGRPKPSLGCRQARAYVARLCRAKYSSIWGGLHLPAAVDAGDATFLDPGVKRFQMAAEQGGDVSCGDQCFDFKPPDFHGA
jgi:hypothetical protein